MADTVTAQPPVTHDPLKKKDPPRPYNLRLDPSGRIKVHSYEGLKPRHYRMFRGLSGEKPLALVVEADARGRLAEILEEADKGFIHIAPVVYATLRGALNESMGERAPIMPPTDCELVAHVDEQSEIRAVRDDPALGIRKGVAYSLKTGSLDRYRQVKRIRMELDEMTGVIKPVPHVFTQSFIDRYIEINTSAKSVRFMSLPDEKAGEKNGGRCLELNEARIWEWFERPDVKTVAEVMPDRYKEMIEELDVNAMLAGFEYFKGQSDYLARLGCRDYGYVAADTGAGKSCIAIGLMLVKQDAKRILVMAPKGTVKGDDGQEHEYDPAQWEKEIRRFAPYLPVRRLFSISDYRKALREGGGQLPEGVFITYHNAYFGKCQNGVQYGERLPRTWDETKFCQRTGLPVDPNRPDEMAYSLGIGHSNADGIRCVWQPSMATMVGDVWDMVVLDEAHLIRNLSSGITRDFIRLKAKYRFALSATPIPNILTNVFAVSGWLCVPDWFKGRRMNTAWPYTLEDVSKFNATFLSEERDLTEETRRRKADPTYKGKATKSCPLISSPMRFLKIFKQFAAYISKKDCNPDLVELKIHDMPVDLGKEQKQLYAKLMDLNNIPGATVAECILKQYAALRAVCADPVNAPQNVDPETEGKIVHSNLNPKLLSILGIIKDRLNAREQIIVISSRIRQTDEIARRLRDSGIDYRRIDSTVLSDKHSAQASEFKAGHAPVMLMGINCAQAYSFGACSNLVIASLEWTYGSFHQAIGRSWRLDSPKECNVYVVLCKDTIESMLFETVGNKADSATLCLHGQHIPRDYKELDAHEVLHEHLKAFKSGIGGLMSESDCEAGWSELKAQMVAAGERYRQGDRLAAS